MKDEQLNATTEQIWRELSDRLRQFIRSRVASEADVADILQTVYLRIHENIHAVRRVERLESWVFQITRNAVTDHFRRQRDLPHKEPSPRAVEPPDDAANVYREVAGCLASLIDRLPEEQKRAVTLYELEGVSQADVAQRESISLSGAKSRIQRGRRTLEAMLRECCRFHLDARGNLMEYEALTNDCQPECGCHT